MTTADPPEKDKKTYELALQFLAGMDDRVTPTIIENHISDSELDRPDDMSIIFRRLIDSARNAQMKRNVIGNLDDLGEALCYFDPLKVLQRYNSDPRELLTYIANHIKKGYDINLSKQGIWPQYCRSIISAASFLHQFGSAREFHDYVTSSIENEMSLSTLPILISNKIHGVGFALACDFLKEIGYQHFAKPDVHLKSIFSSLGLSKSENDFEVFDAVVRMAKNTGETPYTIDKIFWLIGSGYFYRSEIGRVGRHGEEFIEWAKPQLD